MTEVCNNCGTQFNSKYCPECGQKAEVKRLTMHSLLHEAWHGFTHTDKGFLKLWKDLFARPGTAYRNYFSGKRKSYFSPVVFFLLSFGLYIYCDQKVFDYQDHLNLIKTGHLFNNEVGRYIQEHSKYIALTVLPIQALLTYLFFYRRANLAECIVFWLFCVGFTNTLLILLTPVRLLLIDYKVNVEYAMSLLTMVVYTVHLVAAFGKGFLSMFKAAIVVMLVFMFNTYVGFFFLNRLVNMPYPTLAQAFRVTFLNGTVMYINGKTTIV